MIAKKTIYDITQDELNFIYAHIDVLKIELAKAHNLNVINQAIIDGNKQKQNDKKGTNEQRISFRP